MLVISTSFLIVDSLTAETNEIVKLVFYTYEALVINVYILVGYALVFKRLKAYHQDLIEYSGLSDNEAALLRQSLKDIFKFFALICQTIAIWSIYESLYII